MEPRVVSRRLLADGRFLRLEEVTWEDRDGKPHLWEAAQRNVSGVAALVVAVLRPSDRLVMIRQFRPPLGGFALELPAGLVDAGESLEEAAARELKEETGYDGVVRWRTPVCSSSAGMTGELVTTVCMDIHEELETNRRHERNLQDNEDIEVILVPLAELGKALADAVARGDVIDSRLAVWAMAQGARW